MNMEKSKIEQISPDLRKVLAGFLNEEIYQDIFKDMAYSLGYKGDDKEKIMASLFSADPNGRIGFCIAELNGLFFEYQTIEKVKNVEPYKTLLETHPERRSKVTKLAKKMLDGEDIHQEELEKLFNK